ncbi:MAG: S8 family serine peptidase [Clostridiales bacterium]|nr:S8 family serine peptidase [Clostridiales bacterium]
MKQASWYILSVIFVFLICLRAYASEDKRYMVRLNKEIELFSAEEKGRRDFIVADEEELEEYIERGEVEFYEEDSEVYLFSDYWNLDVLCTDLPDKINCLGNGVKAAVIDTGIQPIGGIEEKTAEGHNYLDDSDDVTDNVGHGTFVSGIIASESAGIAVNCTIVPLKCFDSGKSTYVSDLIDAVYDAADVYDCQVINMSFGFSSYSSLFKEAVDYVTEKGLITAAAVGNEGGTSLSYPAAYDNVIGVGSVDSDLNVSSFSRHNTSVFVTAPGENLTSLSISGYSDNSGTSFAAPHITALAAIAKSADESITADDFKSLIISSATDLGDEGYDTYYGWGVVNYSTFLEEEIKDYEYFLSVIDCESGSYECTIYNNNDSGEYGRLVIGGYDDEGRLCDFIIKAVEIDYNETVTTSFYVEGSSVKASVWRDVKSLRPYSKERSAESGG